MTTPDFGSQCPTPWYDKCHTFSEGFLYQDFIDEGEIKWVWTDCYKPVCGKYVYSCVWCLWLVIFSAASFDWEHLYKTDNTKCSLPFTNKVPSILVRVTVKIWYVLNCGCHIFRWIWSFHKSKNQTKLGKLPGTKFCFQFLNTFMYFIFTYLLPWEFFSNINLSTLKRFLCPVGSSQRGPLFIYPSDF